MSAETNVVKYQLSELMKIDDIKDDIENQEEVKEEEQPAAIVRISPAVRPVLKKVSSSPSLSDTTWGLRRRLLLDEERLQVNLVLGPVTCHFCFLRGCPGLLLQLL